MMLLVINKSIEQIWRERRAEISFRSKNDKSKVSLYDMAKNHLEVESI